MPRVGTHGEMGLPTHSGVPVAYAYGGSPLSLYHCQGNSVVESTTENRVVVRSSRTLGTMLE